MSHSAPEPGGVGASGTSDQRRPDVRVVLVDDSARVRAGVRRLLVGEAGIDVVGDAPGADEGEALIRDLRPDVALVDLDMPGADGCDLTIALAESAPGTRVVILTVSDDADDAAAALLAGAAGYVVKSTPAREIAMAVRSAARGETFLTPVVATRLLAMWRPAGKPRDDSGLSPRELAVLRLVAEGNDNEAIADALVISPNTVRRHVQSILRKLGTHNRTEAAVVAVRSRLI